MQEIYEIFEAVQNNNLVEARQEIYDSIAVLLRLDKVLQKKQRNEYFKKKRYSVLRKQLNRNLESRNEIRSPIYGTDSHHSTAVLCGCASVVTATRFNHQLIV